MIFQEYKNFDGTYEMRLRPEDALDCDEIDECSKCVFENEPDIVCDSMFGSEGTLFPNSSGLIQKNPHSFFAEDLFGIETISGREAIKRFGIPTVEIPKMFEDQEFEIHHQVETRSFTIKNGKVYTDPETKKIMKELGLIDMLENSYRDEDTNQPQSD